jgi:Spy/CpxP family protein refolding chaperone
LLGQTAKEEAATSIMIFPPPPAAFEQLKQHLGLTAAQVEQLIQILREKSEADQQRYREINAKRTELNNLLTSGSRDVNRIGQLMLDIHTLSTQTPPPDDQWRQRALAVLTPEQRVKLGTLEQAMKLNTPAYQAVTLNLIDPPPPSPPVILGGVERGTPPVTLPAPAQP